MRRFISSSAFSFFLLLQCFFTHPAYGLDSDRTIVLVHGAFADGSSWNKVIPLLQSKGFKVVAVQNPLRSLEDDAATVTRAINNQEGKVTLVGHSWGGAVITAAGDNPKVDSLVYIAAFAPGDGQSAFDLVKNYPTTPGFLNIVSDASGFQYLTQESMTKDFAQDLPLEETQVMFATQGPIAGPCFTQALSKSAWTTKPSWYLIAENDRIIPPELQKDLALKLNANTLSLPTSHVPMLSSPAAVADFILSAAEAKDSPDQR